MKTNTNIKWDLADAMETILTKAKEESKVNSINTNDFACGRVMWLLSKTNYKSLWLYEFESVGLTLSKLELYNDNRLRLPVYISSGEYITDGNVGDIDIIHRAVFMTLKYFLQDKYSDEELFEFVEADITEDKLLAAYNKGRAKAHSDKRKYDNGPSLEGII